MTGLRHLRRIEIALLVQKFWLHEANRLVCKDVTICLGKSVYFVYSGKVSGDKVCNQWGQPV